MSSSISLHSLTARLSYADTDPAGILYFAAWFPWMERVQSEFFYHEGLRQDRMSEQYGFSTVTRRAECDYLIPVGLFDQVRIDLFPGVLRTSSFQSLFEMRRTVDEALVARGSLIVATVGPRGDKVPVPAVLLERLAQWHARSSAAIPPARRPRGDPVSPTEPGPR